jgi:hypothetical protein
MNNNLLPAIVALVVVLVPTTRPADAQDAPATRWTGSAEASGNLLYGAASQRILAASVSSQRINDAAELRLELQGAYGDSRRTSDGLRDVTVRNTLFRTSVDLRPRARVTPFGFGTAASSLQQRFALRTNVGAGAKYTIWRPDSVRSGFPEDASLSLAILAEQTRALRDPSVDSEVSREASATRSRWSVRARYRRLLAPYLRLSHVTFYQPTVSDMSRYTLEASTVLGIPLRDRVDFTITHRERIDSEAELRGAPGNRDGQLLFGLRAAFR